MDKETYKGVARLEDGTERTTEGSITECARWADKIVQNAGARCRIDIERVAGEQRN